MSGIMGRSPAHGTTLSVLTPGKHCCTHSINGRVLATPERVPGERGPRHRIVSASAEAGFGPKSLGVVYNHTIRAQGFLTGEITFAPKAGTLPADLSAGSYPGLKRIVAPHVYELNARTPAELKSLFNALSARPDLAWVEVPVRYGLTATP